MLSSTVTTAVDELEFPLVSVTVNVTVLSPISLQSKLEIFKELVSIAQLSNEPSSISDADILASPLHLIELLYLG